jgi:hypothetical protein
MARDLVRVRAPVTLLSPERLPADSTLSLVPCGGVHLWQLAKIMGTSVAQLEDTYARWLKRTDERLVAAFDAYDLREASISPCKALKRFLDLVEVAHEHDHHRAGVHLPRARRQVSPRHVVNLLLEGARARVPPFDSCIVSPLPRPFVPGAFAGSACFGYADERT